jgi:uncharacterized protein (TIGR00255 family)
MIKSMTGFASVSREHPHAAIGVTIKTLNHRYLDLQVRVPPSLGEVETRLRAEVQRHIARGRVEVAIQAQLRAAGALEVELNHEFTNALTAALDQARERGLVAGPLTPGDLLRLPQALTIRDRTVDRDPELMAAVAAAVEDALRDALAALDEMRAREGAHLRTDLDVRRSLVAGLVERVAGAAEEGRAQLEARLAERVKDLSATADADPAAIAAEIVRAAARSDISEELARFRGHVAHWDTLADAPEPCGRKLDFLLQEMNREVNTMSSKADGLKVPELIIAAKAELEKMREQVQNVE